MTMGKGLEAILKAPTNLKRVESDEVTTEEVTTEEVNTKEVTTKEKSAEEVNKGGATIIEIHSADVATKDERIAEVITKEVVTEGVTIIQVTTRGVTIHPDVIAKAISDAKRSPRISTWSPLAVGTLKSLWMSQPQFSMSDEIRSLIEEGLAKKYPELVEMVKKELEKNG
jgi:hypothetical protein